MQEVTGDFFKCSSIFPVHQGIEDEDKGYFKEVNMKKPPQFDGLGLDSLRELCYS